MNNKLIYLVLAMALLVAGAATMAAAQQATPPSPYSPYFNATAGDKNELIFDPFDIDPSVLPDMRDLPIPASLRRRPLVRQYTGIIKNKTNYEVSVPSKNSSATLVIPPHSFIEYIAWSHRFDVTAYRDGRPFYCLNINASPKSYEYMCQKYDFIAEIVKPEPVAKKKYGKMKRAIKKPKPVPEGEETG